MFDAGLSWDRAFAVKAPQSALSVAIGWQSQSQGRTALWAGRSLSLVPWQEFLRRFRKPSIQKHGSCTELNAITPPRVLPSWLQFC